MLNIRQLNLNICTAYLAWVRELYPNEEDGADRLITVLRIYRWQLRRYVKQAIPAPLTLDQIQMYKTGIRISECLLEDINENEPEAMHGWYWGSHEQNQAQRLANILCDLIMEFTKEITEAELQHPALKKQFDDERAEYRAMKDAADQC